MRRRREGEGDGQGSDGGDLGEHSWVGDFGSLEGESDCEMIKER